jgi:serine/threonine protein phosphatase PrpC
MSFVLLESLSLPGGPINEDAFAHGENVGLVLDGATPLGEALMPGPSDAAWLAQFGARRLMAHLGDGDAPKNALAHALADAEKSFTALRRRAVREKWETPCASMMLVVFSGPLRPSLAREPATATSPASALRAHRGGGSQPAALEFLWFGDCTALLLQNESCEIIGDAFDKRGQEADRARKLAKEKNLPPAPDLNRPEILSALRAGRNRINSGSNWLFSPDPRAAAHVSHRRVKAAPGDMLLIASDGFLALATDYGAYDGKGLVTAARDRGLAALGEELRAIEEADPLGEKFARYKKSDDATALFLELT